MITSASSCQSTLRAGVAGLSDNWPKLTMRPVTEPVAEQPHMPEYGVGGDGWKPLPWSWASERLGRYRNFWVVTVSPEGRPHAMPVWGVWDDDEQGFAFSCAPGSRKAANLRSNPQVTVAGDSTVEAISIEGTATELSGTESAEPWIEAYIKKYGPDTSPEFLRQNSIFLVSPERVFAIIETEDEFSTRATRWRFPGGRE